MDPTWRELDPGEEHQCDFPECHAQATCYIVPIKSYSCDLHVQLYP